MKYKKLTTIILGGVCVLIVTCYLFTEFGSRDVSIDESKEYQVAYVIDGDTFKVKIGWKTITVRMLGIDTPETVDPRKPAQCYGHKASETSKSLLIGHPVSLKANPDREIKDKYGRYLLYVYVRDLFVNEYLLEHGFAHEYTYGKPYSLQSEFRNIEREAREAKRGLWGACETI